MPIKRYRTSFAKHQKKILKIKLKIIIKKKISQQRFKNNFSQALPKK
jgi:hypothetical protein